MSDELVRQSEFAARLRLALPSLNQLSLRKLVFDYATLYQDVYWFDQLENAFAFLNLCGLDPAAMPEDLATTREEVEIAMGEYFESLNEVSATIYRLLDTKPFSADDVLTSIAHIWCAHACNESPSTFLGREDAVVCELLSTATAEAK